MKGVVGGPETGALCRESIDGPIVLVPYAFLTVVESVEESGIIYMKLVRTDTNDWACLRCVSVSKDGT